MNPLTHLKPLTHLTHSIVDLSFRGISLDSRKVQPNDLFFALRSHAKGHQHTKAHIKEAIARGAVAVIYEGDNILLPEVVQNVEMQNAEMQNADMQIADMQIANMQNANMENVHVPLIPYSNLQHALGFMASRFYNHPTQQLSVIGITGTNGKTTTAYLIAQLLEKSGIKTGIIGTLGAGFLNDSKASNILSLSNLTTPDALEQQQLMSTFLANKAQCVVEEVTSVALHQGRVQGVLFNTAIFTNLTRDHLDYHGSMDAYFAEKKRLFLEFAPKNIILNLDDENGLKLAQLLLKDKPKSLQQLLGYTLQKESPLQNIDTITASELTFNEHGIQCYVQTPWGEGEVSAPLLGQFNAQNILASIAALLIQEVPLKTILQHIPNLKPIPGRMNRFGGTKDKPLVVIDYAHTPDALSQVLKAVRAHCRGRIYCVFGCGGERDRGKRPLMGRAAEQYADEIIITNDNPRSESEHQIAKDILEGFVLKTPKLELDRKKAIMSSIHSATPNDIIVVAGKGHEEYQIIGTQKHPFKDEWVVKEIFQSLGEK